MGCLCEQIGGERDTTGARSPGRAFDVTASERAGAGLELSFDFGVSVCGRQSQRGMERTAEAFGCAASAAGSEFGDEFLVSGSSRHGLGAVKRMALSSKEFFGF